MTDDEELQAWLDTPENQMKPFKPMRASEMPTFETMKEKLKQQIAARKVEEK